MISWIGAVFLVLGFLAVMRLFRLAEQSSAVIQLAQNSLGIIRNPEMDDGDKETALQSNSKQLFLQFIQITLGALVALFAPVGVLWVFDRFGWISLDAVFSVAMSPIFLLLTCVAIPAVFLLWKRRAPSKSDYSAMERALHRVAFRTRIAQIALVDFEDARFAKKLARCSPKRPVFITALPRAGTTLILEICARSVEFAAHCYRDMPFVLTPCLWAEFSSVFQRSGERIERAHGDGMEIDFDSPEALEEVLWQAFWRKQYAKDRILTWGGGKNPEFEEFFRNHMRKIISLRVKEGQSNARYISKNNLNIARIDVLRNVFPDATIVVPFREPVHHAASLLEQHRNFLKIHREDRFASEYMRAIGHYDFGDNLRPVDFGQWYDGRKTNEPCSLDFWLEYWIAAYTHLLAQQEDVHLLSYEEFCSHPEAGLRSLAKAIGCRAEDDILAEAKKIRSPRPREVDTDSISPSLLEEVGELHSRLKETAIAHATMS